MNTPDLAGRKVAITGATGFLGPHLVKAFTDAGAKVSILARPTSDTKRIRDWNPEVISGDVLTPSSLAPLVAGASIVVHAAGVVLAKDWESYRKANVDGTRNMVKAAADAKAETFILVSSLAAAGPAHEGRPPRREEDGTDPQSWYGRSKREAELALERGGASMKRNVMLRAGAIYGPWDKAFLAYFKLVKLGVKPVLGDGERTFQPVHAQDVSQAAIAATHAPDGINAYFIVPKDCVTWTEFGTAIERAMDKKAFTIKLPEMLLRPDRLEKLPFAKAAADRFKDFFCDRWEADPSKADRDLGWTAETSLSDGLLSTHRWYRDQNWI